MKTRIMRAPDNFHRLIKGWSEQAKTKGYNYSMTDIQSILANNMGGMDFRPDMRLFKKRDLYDLVFPLKKRK